MLNLIARRLIMAIPILAVVSMLTFLLQSLAPGDAAATLLGTSATPEALEALRQELGLNLPWYQQWFAYVLQVLQGNLGNSVATGAPVAQLINERLPVTLSLIVLAAILSLVVGVLLGTVSAIRLGFLGRLVDGLAMAGLAVPGFWLGLVLVALFAVQLHWFPAIGYVPAAESVGEWLRSLTLPVLALGLSGFSIIAKTTRDAVLEVRSRDYFRTLRANGMGRTSLLVKHTAKNAAINLVTVVSLTMIASLTGTVFIESVFALPGIGSLATRSSLSSDLPVVQGVALYYTVIVILINLVVDISYGWLNPKVRTS